MKKGLPKKRCLAALVTALLFLTALLTWWRWALGPVGSEADSSSQIFVINKGESLSLIADRLKEKGLIRSALAFRFWVMGHGLARDIQAGSFRIDPSLNIARLVDGLTHGTLDLWLTFPEGWRREQVGQRLQANLADFDYQEFLSATGDLEGRLFPDTYLFPVDAGASQVLSVIRRNFEIKLGGLESEIQNSGFTQEEILTLASLVEREAKKQTDRPLIAGILIKRWREDWPLQVDATVQYAKDSFRCSATAPGAGGEVSRKCEYWEPVTKTDLQLDSPYNTYRNKGLPPGPICNPGLEAIKAVLRYQDSDYWFYLSDSSGVTHFAKTAEEHAQNVDLYLR